MPFNLVRFFRAAAFLLVICSLFAGCVAGVPIPGAPAIKGPESGSTTQPNKSTTGNNPSNKTDSYESVPKNNATDSPILLGGGSGTAEPIAGLFKTNGVALARDVISNLVFVPGQLDGSLFSVLQIDQTTNPSFVAVVNQFSLDSSVPIQNSNATAILPQPDGFLALGSGEQNGAAVGIAAFSPTGSSVFTEVHTDLPPVEKATQIEDQIIAAGRTCNETGCGVGLVALNPTGEVNPGLKFDFLKLAEKNEVVLADLATTPEKVAVAAGTKSGEEISVSFFERNTGKLIDTLHPPGNGIANTASKAGVFVTLSNKDSSELTVTIHDGKNVIASSTLVSEPGMNVSWVDASYVYDPDATEGSFYYKVIPENFPEQSKIRIANIQFGPKTTTWAIEGANLDPNLKVFAGARGSCSTCLRAATLQTAERVTIQDDLRMPAILTKYQ